MIDRAQGAQVMSVNDGVILLDGGVGRELKRRGVEVPPTTWTAKALLSDPDTVRDVHAAFIEAGADVITANNYAVVPKLLMTEGMDGRLVELTQLAARLANQARETGGRNVLIAGVLPPLARTYRADLVGTAHETYPIYREIADSLAADVDIMLCETMSSSVEARVAAQAAAQTGRRIWVSWTLDDEASGRLRSGESVSQALAALDGIPVEATLLNCTQPESISVALRNCVETRASWWAAMPMRSGRSRRAGSGIRPGMWTCGQTWIRSGMPRSSPAGSTGVPTSLAAAAVSGRST